MLKDAGFDGRRRNYTLVWPELTWMVHTEAVPRRSFVGMDAGISLEVLIKDESERPTEALGCPVMLAAPGSAFRHNRPLSEEALDSESELEDEERIKRLQAIVRAIREVAYEVRTVEDLNAMAADGRFYRSGIVRREVQDLLRVKDTSVPDKR